MTNQLTGRELDAAVAEKVMGIILSATTPAEIGKAAFSGFWASLPKRSKTKYVFYWNGKEHELLTSDNQYGYGGAAGNDGYGLYFWENRKGTPYEADIEAHVAAWRAGAAPYSSDRNACLKVLTEIERKDLEERFINALSEDLKGLTFWACLTAPPATICRAALRAVEEGR